MNGPDKMELIQMGQMVKAIKKIAMTKKENPVFHNIRAPGTNRSPVNRILLLQRTIGNKEVQRMIKSGTLQTKLRIGQPGDKYEQEADGVADAVMKMPLSFPGRIVPIIQKKCQGCEEEEIRRPELMAKGDNTPEIAPYLESNILALRGGGKPLPASTRAFFDPRFGADFSMVRVHTGSQANELANGVNARAFTLGSDVVFGAGQYSPETIAGKRLLAHELTHVIQQGKTGVHRSVEQQSLIRMSIADAFDSYRGTCDCGENLGNNCAHYLSDAFIRAGYNDLDGGTGGLFRRHNGRVVCKAGRPVRARELRDWFSSNATATSNGEPDDNQYWAVYQHDGYPGGHVVIHNHTGTNYTWRGTGDYPDWGTQDHYTW